jgi:hypothetical protein
MTAAVFCAVRGRDERGCRTDHPRRGRRDDYLTLDASSIAELFALAAFYFRVCDAHVRKACESGALQLLRFRPAVTLSSRRRSARRDLLSKAELVVTTNASFSAQSWGGAAHRRHNSSALCSVMAT